MARFTVNGIDVFVEQYREDKERMLVLLHGFTGSTKTWQHIVPLLSEFHVVTVDLIGHGQTAAPRDVSHYTMEAQVELLEELFKQLELSRFSLLGYSMGGRVALSYAVRYPSRIEQLLLESASPGIIVPKERAARQFADNLLAEKIEANGIPPFVEAWENIALFASQKQLSLEVQQEIRAERLMQREMGLANSLRGMGTGIMPSLWHQLRELQFPVTLLTGSVDVKFEDIAQKMLRSLPDGRHVSIIGAGHAIHVENPTKFATIVKEAISEDNLFF